MLKTIKFLVFIFLISCNSDKIESFNDAYKKLDLVKNNRISRVKSYFEELKDQAGLIHSDSLMQSIFIQEKESFENNKSYTPDLRKLERILVYHHIKNYPLFYNIFFVDTKGHVFHSIIEPEEAKSLFSDSLWQEITQKYSLKTELFVDFINDNKLVNPSSFFIEPLYQSGEHIGYIVLQVLINKLNNIVAHIDDWSQTGEVLLINKSQLILNNPRFLFHEDMLQQKISKDNLMRKLSTKNGHFEVLDYRNKKVLSSFEIFSFMETDWLISAKIDKAEILTMIYRSNPQKFKSIFLETSEYSMKQIDSIILKNDVKYVLMDEFKRLDSKGVLYTKSIHTCTGLLIRYPGRFAYLAHISPIDVSYNNTGTNLVNQMMNQIENKEIIRSETHNLDIQIISPTQDAVRNIVNNLLNKGVFLSQITVITNPNAIFADVAFDFTINKTTVFWKTDLYINSFLKQDPDICDDLANKMEREYHTN